MATLQDAITIARGYLQDTVAPYRYSDTDLLQYGNDALWLMCGARPELFTRSETITLINGVQQSVTAAGTQGLVDVLANKNGDAVRPVHEPTLSQFRPTWQNDPKGAARQWFPETMNKFVFYVYPPATAGDALTVLHVSLLPYTLLQALDARVAPYVGIIAEYIASCAEARESEDTGPQRSAKFAQDFIGKIGGRK